MIQQVLLAGLGLLILITAGDLLVRGAVAASLRLGIPALIVSLTVVAFGTSAPELLIAVESALLGAPGIALGNVLGSNIANVLLVLGLPAVLSGFDTGTCDSRQSYIQMLAVSFLFVALCYFGPLYIWQGCILMVLLAAMVWHNVAEARAARGRRQVDPEFAGMKRTSTWRISGFLTLGIAGLPVGAHVLIEAARSIALTIGVSDEVIGLTLIAVGTSLPELATTVMAAIRRHAEVAMGNVIGSNILNILAIMGITSFFGPLPVPAVFLRYDFWVMIGAALLLAPFVLFSWRLGRATGIGFLAAYAAYVSTLF